MFASFVGLLLFVLSAPATVWAPAHDGDIPQHLADIEFEDSIDEEETPERELEDDDIQDVSADAFHAVCLGGSCLRRGSKTLQTGEPVNPFRPPIVS